MNEKYYEEQKMTDEMKKLYSDLLNGGRKKRREETSEPSEQTIGVIEWNKEHETLLTVCPAIAGKKYFNGEHKKIMFVGRAINGWCYLPADSESALNQIQNCARCTLNWVCVDVWKGCKEIGCNIANDKADVYRDVMINSPFWRFIKDICCEKCKMSKDDWYENIVWTNLYKVAPADGGNPPSEFYKEEVMICDELLQKEVEKYDPDVIYFITESKGHAKDGRTWFVKEFNYGKYRVDFPTTYEYLKDRKIKVYVTERPEYRKKGEIVICKFDSGECFTFDDFIKAEDETK